MPLTAMLACLILQNTWVVDDTPGPGVNFSDLPPAVAAAADGDILLVQPGTYSHFTLAGKGLRILGSGASSTFVTGSTAVSTTISNVPAGSVAYVDRMSFNHQSLGSFNCNSVMVSILGSTTRVALADVVLIHGPAGAQGEGVESLLRVEGSEVWVFRSTLGSGGILFGGLSSWCAGVGGGKGLHALGGAFVHLSGCTLEGADYVGCGSCGCAPAATGGRGALIEGGSEVRIADSLVTGGRGSGCQAALCLNLSNGGAGIEVINSVVRVSGSPATSIVRGGLGATPFNGLFACFAPTGNGGPGILSVGGTVTVHSVPVIGGAAGLWGVPGPPTQGPGITVGAPPLPVLQLTGTLTLTGTATITLTNGLPNAAYVIAFAAAPGFVPGGSFFLGEILLDPSNWYLLAIGSLTPVGDVALTLPLAGIPPGFVNLPVYLQGLAFDQGGFWRMSNSTVAAIRP